MVAVAPFIRIRQQKIRGQNHGSAVLECEVEAFPEPVTWWERGDGRLIQSSSEYRMDIYDKRDIYKVNHNFPMQFKAILFRAHSSYSKEEKKKNNNTENTQISNKNRQRANKTFFNEKYEWKMK